MEIDLSQFNHCYSTDPPKPIVQILGGEHKGRIGRLMGQWTHPYHLWVVYLSDTNEWIKVPPGQFSQAKGGE